MTDRAFTLAVLGRTLEHLGVQMYKRREAALAELVANAWDAGAVSVAITVPEALHYDPNSSKVFITDDGCGMSQDQVQDEYLVVGRNRRKGAVAGVRPVMGRKGIGKLSGFGLADRMTVETWRSGELTEFTLDAAALKKDDGKTHEVTIPGRIEPSPSGSTATGTRLILSQLKHVTSINVEKLSESLARRFSRRIRGEMTISVNGVLVGEPTLELEARFPEDGVLEHQLPSGGIVRYQYAFAKSPIHSVELRGFAVYVRGKTAQAAPFFFNVEGTASGQHATRYVMGTIEADFLDEGTDDESDVISTDRQEIDWESAAVAELRDWGDALSRQVLRDWADRRAETFNDWVLQDEQIAARLDALDAPSQKQARSFLRLLAQAEGATDRGRELASALIRAYEFRQFHDFVQTLEVVSDDPDAFSKMLSNLADWRVLESRAVLEIVKGRLAMIDRLGTMIVNDAPETAPRVGADNLHDMLARYPWLLHPEWQVLAEEKTVTKQLREWGAADVHEDYDIYKERFDFLGATLDNHELIVVDIKRPGHSASFDEVQRADRYRERLSQAHPSIRVMVVATSYNVSASVSANWDQRPDADLLLWSKLFDRVKRHYEHWRDLLEGDTSGLDWKAKEAELASTRHVLDSGTAYRTKEERRAGLGPQEST